MNKHRTIEEFMAKQSTTVSISGNTVTIDFDNRTEAQRLFDRLTSKVRNREQGMIRWLISLFCKDKGTYPRQSEYVETPAWAKRGRR